MVNRTQNLFLGSHSIRVVLTALCESLFGF